MWSGAGHDDDDDDDDDDDSGHEMVIAQHHHQSAVAGHDDDSDSDSDDDSDAEMVVPTAGVARGKPEAMAARLASAARLQEKMDELEAEEDHLEVEAEPVEDPLDATMETVDTVATVETKDTAAPATPATTTPKKKNRKAPTTPASSSSTTPKKKASSSSHTSHHHGAHPTMDDPVVPITADEYANLEQLMIQFCRVPLLAEFSRPVALLHPELMTAYSKIVEHPVDLGLVCRKVRKREYECLRDVQLDAWRIFSNCVRYHSHQSNKEAVPSFVSIALHLRNYFNALWQEHMLPSDPPKQASTGGKAKSGSKTAGLDAKVRAAFERRQQDRKIRMVVSALSLMTGKSLVRAADTLKNLIENGGRVDPLDKEPIFGDEVEEEDDDIDIVVDNLHRLKARLEQLSESGADYGIDELERDVRKCYTEDVLENNPGLRMRIAHRMDRWIGKIVVPIHEATCRGVSQSSIWGCMAAVIWARESSKKPYWPALVLGIMAPDHQREDWHHELTLRNEMRLPDKLKTQLVTGKRKAEASLKKQKLGQMEAQSYFLVEFLGTHEFIWVREADIVEDFDAAEDPNQNGGPAGGTKKKGRSSRSNIANIIGSKMYATSIEEAQWALEEFELQLQDVGSDGPEEDDEGYSYPVLAQSDDEADEVEVPTNKVDIDELNELLATNGLIDFTASGRKNAKKRAQALKKQKQDQEKKQKLDKVKKMKAEQNKKKKDARAMERESKKEQKELDRKRKRRAREREKALKSLEPKNKKRKMEPEDLKKMAAGRRNLIANKRERATAIVEGYLNRAVQRNDYKTLCLGGMMTIPAAMIDSTGLLGMAMAFRAAAGDLPMPDESGAQKSNIKPWDAMDVDKKKTSSERVELLKKQAELLEKEIVRLKEATKVRKLLTEEARADLAGVEKKVEAGDRAARDNPLKKKKAPDSSEKKKGNFKSPGGKSPKTPASVAPSEGEAESTLDADTASHDADDMANGDSSGDEAMTASVGDNDGDGDMEDDDAVVTAVEVDI